jgi:hypothetical protein
LAAIKGEKTLAELAEQSYLSEPDHDLEIAASRRGRQKAFCRSKNLQPFPLASVLK